MIYNFKRYKKVIAAITVILLIISGIVYKNTVFDTQIVLVEEVEQPKETQVKAEETKVLNTDITVYVCGSVKKVANVTLPKDSRVEEAIKMAGGVTANADLNGINMAQKLLDEDMVYVPKKGEIIEAGVRSLNVTPSPAKKGKLDINKANVEQLDTLPGIGPSIAQKIVEYRNSRGGFKSIEEVNNVSGIGEEKYKDIKNLITIN